MRILQAARAARIAPGASSRSRLLRSAPSGGRGPPRGRPLGSRSTATDLGALVDLPLDERPAVSRVSLAELTSWRDGALRDLPDLSAEGGPTRSELGRELVWLLDDAVAGVAADEAGPLVEGGAVADVAIGERALLRTPFEDLKGLWRERVEGRVPLAYLTGSAHWRDVTLAVPRGVLVPRPETSSLADLALRLAADGPHGPWADLGTGSGALAMALARELPGADPVWAVDASALAVAAAALNARRLGVAGRVRPLEASWNGLLTELSASGGLAGVVSNPPYVVRGAIEQAEVAMHEPDSALYGGGDDGGDCLRAVVRASRRLVRPGGALALETGGRTQAEELVRWAEEEGGFHSLTVSSDLFGVPRFVSGRRATGD